MTSKKHRISRVYLRFLIFCGKLEFEMGSNFLNVRQFAIFILQLSDENLITVKEISDFVTRRKTCGIQSAACCLLLYCVARSVIGKE